MTSDKKIENISDGAFFISPTGELTGVGNNKHINIITSNPEKFGLTIEKTRNTYNRYGERMGTEGRAREEIILDLIEKGWIHIRKRPNRYWIINVYKMTKKYRELLSDWANKILKGTKGVKELNRFAPVKILTIDGEYSRDLTVDDMVHFAPQETSKISESNKF